MIKNSKKFNKIKIIYWDNKEVEIDICNKLKQRLKKKTWRNEIYLKKIKKI